MRFDCYALAIILSSSIPIGCNARHTQPLPNQDPTTVQALVQKLQSPDAESRKAAAEALKLLGPTAKGAVEPLLKARYEERNRDNWVRYECGQAIIAIGRPAVPALAKALGDKKNRNRYDAAQLLLHMSRKHNDATIKPAVPALVEALDDDKLVSSFAVRALGSLGPEAREAIPALEKALDASVHPFNKQQLARVLIAVAGQQHEAARSHLQQFGKDQRLIELSWKEDASKVRQLLDNGANVNARYVDFAAFVSSGMSGYTALMAATSQGNKEIVELLINNGADVNVKRKRRTALFFAVRASQNDIVDLLVKAGAMGDPKKIRLTETLITAACTGFRMQPGEPHPHSPGARRRDIDHTLSIPEILVQGANVNWADENGYTPLMYAANLGLLENVRILVSLGADVDLKTLQGDTALDLAMRSKRVDVIEYLKSQHENGSVPKNGQPQDQHR